MIQNERTIAIYGKDKAVEYAVKCPACNGGHSQAVERVKSYSDIPQAFYDANYSDFDWDIYRNEKGYSIDLREQKKFVESFISDFEKWEKNGLGLYIWSHLKGSGKTFLASCICNELMSRYEIHTKFVPAANLISMVKAADKDKDQTQDPIEALCNCRLLVIDDLGQRNVGTEWMTDLLFRISDERMQKRRVTIVTSNIKLLDLHMDDRVIDRLNRLCQPIPLPDYCVRTKESNAMKISFFKELGLMQ